MTVHRHRARLAVQGGIFTHSSRCCQHDFCQSDTCQHLQVLLEQPSDKPVHDSLRLWEHSLHDGAFPVHICQCPPAIASHSQGSMQVLNMQQQHCKQMTARQAEKGLGC